MVVLATSTSTFGQDTAQVRKIREGDRVRVTAPEYLRKRLAGTLASLTSDTMAVERRGDIVKVPLNGVTEVELSLGYGNDPKRGAAYGAVLGAAAALAVCMAESCFSYSSDGPSGAGLFVLLVLPGFAAGGMVIGGLIGYTHEEWVPVPLESLATGAQPPSSAAVGLRFTLPLPLSTGAPAGLAAPGDRTRDRRPCQTHVCFRRDVLLSTMARYLPT